MTLGDVSVGTFGSMQPVPAPAPTEPIVNDVQPTVDNTPEPGVPDNTVQPNEPTIELPQEPAVNQNQSNDLKIDFPDFEAQAKQAAEPKFATWQDAVKDVNKLDVLKAVGVDPFVIEMAEHLSKGGSAQDYISAKAIDYKNYSHEQLVKEDLKSKYPQLTTEKLQKLYDNEYKQGESYDDDEKEIGGIRLEARAEELRQKKIAEQQSFKIPDAQQAQIQPNEAVTNYINSIVQSPITRSVQNSKGVAISLPEGKQLFVGFDQPGKLLDVLFDGDTQMKLTRDQKGEPDVSGLLQNALMRINPERYNAVIHKSGFDDGYKAGLEAGQKQGADAKEVEIVNNARNVGLPQQRAQQATTNTTLKQGLQSAKVSTYGSAN